MIKFKEVNMGVLGEMAKGLLGKALGGGSSQNPLMDIVMGLITNPQSGGLQGLIQTFKEKGLGDAMFSWISTGENQSVSGDQMPGSASLSRIATHSFILESANDQRETRDIPGFSLTKDTSIGVSFEIMDCSTIFVSCKGTKGVL